jgi:hypothetical protein
VTCTSRPFGSYVDDPTNCARFILCLGADIQTGAYNGIPYICPELHESMALSLQKCAPNPSCNLGECAVLVSYSSYSSFSYTTPPPINGPTPCNTDVRAVHILSEISVRFSCIITCFLFQRVLPALAALQAQEGYPQQGDRRAQGDLRAQEDHRVLADLQGLLGPWEQRDRWVREDLLGLASPEQVARLAQEDPRVQGDHRAQVARQEQEGPLALEDRLGQAHHLEPGDHQAQVGPLELRVRPALVVLQELVDPLVREDLRAPKDHQEREVHQVQEDHRELVDLLEPVVLQGQVDLREQEVLVALADHLALVDLLVLVVLRALEVPRVRAVQMGPQGREVLLELVDPKEQEDHRAQVDLQAQAVLLALLVLLVLGDLPGQEDHRVQECLEQGVLLEQAGLLAREDPQDPPAQAVPQALLALLDLMAPWARKDTLAQMATKDHAA